MIKFNFLANLYSDKEPGSVILERYHRYLESIRERFCPELFIKIRSPDYYDPQNRNSPHDGWVETVRIQESVDYLASQDRMVGIELRLLGAYHDRYLIYCYRGVSSYEFLLPSLSHRGNRAHGDWHVDEFGGTEKGGLFHVIAFSSQAQWRIQCERIAISTEPLS